ncbi:MAG: type II toxin-antitoxin system VapC family toxin [Bifidobacteriaceae bacterium]|jgi:toxin-antitoxin system PIN domain toxin|nr:type II toxin-antitoxin system VapC family toxin [Bifidobacteriaceae bacterium]
MILPDVNILVAANRSDHPQHEAINAWLATVNESSDWLGLTPAVASGYLRIVTNPRIHKEPTPLDRALEVIDDLLAADRVSWVYPGPDHWVIFRRLCRQANATGNLVQDAHHAAVAIEHGAKWATMDRDFALFPGLDWFNPLNLS